MSVKERWHGTKPLRYGIEEILNMVMPVFKSQTKGYRRLTFKKDILKRPIYEKIKGLGGFRNILARGYLELPDEEVIKEFESMI